MGRSGRTAAQRRRRGSAVAVFVAALTALAAAALSLGPPAAAAGGTTITGKIDFEGRPVAGASVSFDGVGVGQGRTATAADGSFALRTSQEALGHVVVGSGAGTATWTSGGRSFLVAVVGAARPAGAPAVLTDTEPPATPARIAAGGPLLIHLREAGRLTGTAPQLAVRTRVTDPFGVAGRTILQRAVIRVLRRDGSEAGDGNGGLIEADASGTFTTFPLVPGRYRLEYRPKGPVLPVTVDAEVLPGTTTVHVPAFGPGGSIAGTVRTSGASALHLRVELRRGGAVVTRMRTGAGGAYRFDGLAAGDYTVRVPGFGTDSSVPRDPVARDAVLNALTLGAADRSVTVPSGTGTQRADVALPDAATIVGTVPAGRVLVLEDTTGARLRSDVASGLARAVRFGGLTPGRYRLVEGQVGRIRSGPLSGETVVQRYGVRAISVSAGQRLALPAIATTRPAITLSGAVGQDRSAPKSGSPVFLRLGDDPLGTVQGVVDGTHDYRVPGLLPGRWGFLTPSGADPVLLTGATTTVQHDLTSKTASLTVQGRTPDGTRVLVAPRAVSATGGPPPTATSRLVRYGRGSTSTPVVKGAPGAYRWVEGADDPVPAVDGPWWYAAADPAFTIPADPTRPLVLELDVRS